MTGITVEEPSKVFEDVEDKLPRMCCAWRWRQEFIVRKQTTFSKAWLLLVTRDRLKSPA